MYSTKVNGEVIEFSTSGLLYRSNKLMYDRKTESLWSQFVGEPVVGQLADSGIKLEIIPVTFTAWDEWLASHPDTTVLAIGSQFSADEVYPPEWDQFSVYFSYRQDPDTMFPVAQRSELLSTKAQVLGLKVNGRAKAYPLKMLLSEPVINDSLGGENLVVVSKPGTGVSRAYQREGNRFSIAEFREGDPEILILKDRSGSGNLNRGISGIAA